MKAIVMFLAATAVAALVGVTWAMTRVSAWIVFHDPVWGQMEKEGATLEHGLAEACTVEVVVHRGGKHGWLSMVWDVRHFSAWFDGHLLPLRAKPPGYASMNKVRAKWMTPAALNPPRMARLGAGWLGGSRAGSKQKSKSKSLWKGSSARKSQ
jgi:hypothetical protein